MARPIDADALKEKYIMATIRYGSRGAIMERPVVLLEDIVDAPTIDAVSVVHGKWRRKMVDDGFNIDWVCSKCGYRVMTDFVSYNYCPNCGAKMDGERKESE